MIKFSPIFGQIRPNSTISDHLLGLIPSIYTVEVYLLLIKYNFLIKKGCYWVKKVIFNCIREKFEIFDQLNAKFDSRILSNSNSETKFDLEFEFWIRHCRPNSDFFWVEFEIRPSLPVRLTQHSIVSSLVHPPPPSLSLSASFFFTQTLFWSSQLRKIVKNLFQNKCSLKLSKKGVHLSFFLSPSPSHTHTFTRVLSLHWEVLSNNKRKLCRNKTLQQQQHQQQQHQQQQHQQQQHQQHQHKQQQQQRQQPKHARIQKRWIKV